MIFDRVENARSYLGLNPKLDAALEYIASTEIKVGDKISLCDGAVGGGAMPYVTKPVAECKIESHATDIDIHICLKGTEVVGYCPACDGIPMDDTAPDAPTTYYKEAPLEFVTMKPGMFCVALPQDIHVTKATLGEPAEAAKVIMKVK